MIHLRAVVYQTHEIVHNTHQVEAEGPPDDGGDGGDSGGDSGLRESGGDDGDTPQNTDQDLCGKLHRKPPDDPDEWR